MKVTIKSWQAVATWRWDLREDDDTCGICQVAFDATCPRCRFPGDACPLGKSPSFYLSKVEHMGRKKDMQ